MPDFPPDHSDGDAVPQSDRLQILSPEQYELLWGFPRFTQNDRDLFFALTAPEREALDQRRSVRTQRPSAAIFSESASRRFAK